MVDSPAGAEQQRPSKGRRLSPRAARTLGVVVVAGAIVALVVQNSQRVTIRLWFITGHVRLIWVIVVCSCVVAGAGGYVAGRRGRRRRR